MQLDLFNTKAEPEARPAMMIPFPTNRRWSLVVEIAEGLLVLNKTEGRKFWTRHVKQLRRELKASGIPRQEADRQIADLSRAVNIQLDYRSAARSSGQ